LRRTQTLQEFGNISGFFSLHLRCSSKLIETSLKSNVPGKATCAVICSTADGREAPIGSLLFGKWKSGLAHSAPMPGQQRRYYSTSRAKVLVIGNIKQNYRVVQMQSFREKIRIDCRAVNSRISEDGRSGRVVTSLSSLPIRPESD
jgi:hypothetical protein